MEIFVNNAQAAFREDATSELVNVTRGIPAQTAKYVRFESVEEFLQTNTLASAIYSIWYNGLPIDLDLQVKMESPLIVTFHGAILTKARMPWFVGSGLTNGLDSSVLKICDPSMYLDDSLRLAWYAGNRHQEQLQQVILSIVKHVQTLLGSQRVIFFGGSGGGFAALELALGCPGSVALVFNPQTDIEKYDPPAVAQYKEICWNDEVSSNVSTDLVSKYANNGQDLTVIYLQNKNDLPHIKRHMAPFLESLRNPDDHLILLDAWDKGHTPPPRELLRKVLSLAVSDYLLFDFAKLGFKSVAEEIDNRVAWLGTKPRSLAAFLDASDVSRINIDSAQPKISSPKAYKQYFDYPATRSWKVEQQDASTYSVKMPSGATFEVSKSLLLREDFWDRNFPTQSATNKLWFRSCWFAAELARCGDISLALEILKSYQSYIRSRDLNFRNLGMNSLDHCLAINLRTCSWILATIDLAPDDRDLVISVANDVVSVVVGFDFFLGNTHGVMLAIAMLHVAGVAGIDLPPSHSLSAIATFLRAAFDKSVSGSGLVRENTTAYQFMWVGWAWEVAHTFEYIIGVRGVARAFGDLARSIAETGAYLAVDSKTSLPLGDSVKKSSPPSVPKNGILNAAEDGLFVHNNGDGQVFAFTCGSKTAVHRHADDHAFRLFVSGTELIADAGFNSYDTKDPISRCVTSQRGHSGLYFPQFDENHGQKFYPWDAPTRHSNGDMVVLKEEINLISLLSHRVVNDVFHTQRKIEYQPLEGRIVLEDLAIAPKDKVETCPVARFLIPAEFEIQKNESVQFRLGELLMKFSFKSGQHFNIYKGAKGIGDTLDKDHLMGVICPRPGHPEFSWVVESELEEVAPGFWRGETILEFDPGF